MFADLIIWQMLPILEGKSSTLCIVLSTSIWHGNVLTIPKFHFNRSVVGHWLRLHPSALPLCSPLVA